jgi:dTDP-4-amino-4,6-dideoxygalactose transaminase
MHKSNAFLPFALPDIGEEEIAEVVDTLRSGWITTGPKAKRFEVEFAAFLDGEVQALAVNSATAGLHLALEALGVGAGDEVITTTYTFTATAEVARYLGAEPVLVDVDAATLCLSAALIEPQITSRTKAIIPVHFGGMAADMTSIGALARKHGIAIVEDAAHALPCTHHGRMVGTLDSDATVFSFYANKTITTGEGGMLVTRRPDLASRAKTMRLHGISRDAFDRFTTDVPSWYYEIQAPGYKYNLTDLAAAIGIHQLKKAWHFQQQRAAIAARYDEAFAELPITLPHRPVDADTHAWHLYVLRLRPEAPIGRDAFIERMFEAGIGCSVHYIPLHCQPYWRERYQLRPEQFPVADRLWRTAVSLPIYTRMGHQDVERVISTVCGILRA